MPEEQIPDPRWPLPQPYLGRPACRGGKPRQNAIVAKSVLRLPAERDLATMGIREVVRA